MERQLSVINPCPRRIPGPALLHELVANGRQDDTLVAIDHLAQDGTRETLTYGDLHGRSNALALRLVEMLGTTSPASVHIPLFIQQCPELYIAQLATLKAGAAFVPIPIDAPEERLRFICRDVEATVVITTSQLQHRLPTLEHIAVLVVDDEYAGFEQQPPKLSIDFRSPAYVMYTLSLIHI